MTAVNGMRCRACRGTTGEVVLDLGEQPACDYFPVADDPGPDPAYPLQMWLCATCGLAQLVADPTVPEEPRGTEPAVLVKQAARAVRLVADAGWIGHGTRVLEYGSPHGGSWAALLRDEGAHVVDDAGTADAVLDCFGLMHCPDQAAALAERAERVADNGVLLLQFHSLATIVRRSQWTALRHGHYAYYSTAALVAMLATEGFAPRAAWTFDLYGGTVLLAATREGNLPDESVARLLAEEREIGVVDPSRAGTLHRAAESGAVAVRDWLERQKAAEIHVLGYGAASRAVALLCTAGIDSSLLPAIADASAAKQGRRMPGTNIAVISPDDLVRRAPRFVLLFLPDLLEEVRRRFSRIEADGGRWIDVETLVLSSERSPRRPIGRLDP